MIEAGTRFAIDAFVDRSIAKNDRFLGRPVREEGDFLETAAGEAVIFGLGEWASRNAAMTRYRAAGISDFPAVVAPGANVASDVVVGEGTVIMPGACVNPGSRIGAFCVLNTGSILDHDCLMRDGAALAPGVSIGGGCEIGAAAYIGIGASVAHGRRVGDGAVLGGGAFLNSDVGPWEFWGGVPAGFIRMRTTDETVL